MGYTEGYVGVSRKIANDIYIHSTHFTLNRSGTSIGGRMTVIKTSNDPSFIIYSPIPYGEAIIKSISDAMIENGDLDAKYSSSWIEKVTHIFIANKEHNLAVASYKSVIPKAKIFGPEGCTESIDSIIDYKFTESTAYKFLQGDELKEAFNMGEDLEINKNLLNSSIQIVNFYSHFTKETVLYCPKSSTVVLGDLLINIQTCDEKDASPNSDVYNEQFDGSNAPFSFYSFPGIAIRLFNNSNSFCFGALQKFFLKDPENTSAAMKHIMETWDFDTVIMCHGDVVQRNGKSVLSDFFARYL